MKDPKEHVQPEAQDTPPVSTGNDREPDEAAADEKAVRVGDDVCEPDPEEPA